MARRRTFFLHSVRSFPLLGFAGCCALLLVMGCQVSIRSQNKTTGQATTETSTLLDDFSTSMIGTLWDYNWNPTSGYPALSSRTQVSGGQLQFQFYSTDAAWTFSPGAHSQKSYDLTDRWVVYEINNDHDPNLLSWDCGIATGDNETVGAYAYLNTIYFYYRQNGNSTTQLGATVAAPTGTLYVRLRHQSSTLRYYLDYSSDGSSWSTLDSVATWGALDPTQVHFFMGAWGDTVPADTTVKYESVHTNAIEN